MNYDLTVMDNKSLPLSHTQIFIFMQSFILLLSSLTIYFQDVQLNYLLVRHLNLFVLL